jgi:DNA-binding LacI/PurR family transcriptional regulator
MEKQGMIGAEMMRNLLSAEAGLPRKKMHEIVEPHLVIRKSTACAPHRIARA